MGCVLFLLLPGDCWWSDSEPADSGALLLLLLLHGVTDSIFTVSIFTTDDFTGELVPPTGSMTAAGLPLAGKDRAAAAPPPLAAVSGRL